MKICRPAKKRFAAPLTDLPILFVNACGGCHTAGRARIDFDYALAHRVRRRDRGTWEQVLDALSTGTMPPPLTIEPTSHDYGNVPVGGTSESMRFRVTNHTTYGSLPVTVMTTGGEFDIAEPHPAALMMNK